MLIIREDLLAICNKYITIDAEQSEVDLTLLGMDSFSFIKIIVDIEDKYNILIPDEQLMVGQLNTFNKLYEAIVSIASNISE